MFEKGEYVFYGNKGVCEVIDITTMNLTGVPGDRLFYVLHPYFSKEDKIFTPIDNEKIVIRPLISKKKAENLIEELAEIEELQIVDEKMRDEIYKECLRSCECREWIRMIKTLRSRKSKRLQSGKKTTAAEDRYLKIVEDYLYSELCILLEMTKQEMAALFASKLDCNEKCKPIK